MRTPARAQGGGREGPRESRRGSTVRGAGLARPAPDRLERQPTREASRWDAVLLWFMRLVALAWIAKGLVAWAVIVGALPELGVFEAERAGRQAAIAYFGVVDLMAGVGLWLASPWGGVIWLLSATSYLVLGFVLPDLVPSSPPILAAGSALLLIYLTLSSLAAREPR